MKLFFFFLEIWLFDLKTSQGQLLFGNDSGNSVAGYNLFYKKFVRGICYHGFENMLLVNIGHCLLKLHIKNGMIQILHKNGARKELGNRIRRNNSLFFVWSFTLHTFCLL